MEQLFGTKEISNIVIKTNSPITLGNKQLVSGEPIFYLENAQLTELSQSSTPIFSRGGRGNIPLIIWEDQGDVRFRMTAGTMTKEMFSMALGAQIFDSQSDGSKYIAYHEDITLDNEGHGVLHYTPITSRPFFCFIYQNGIIQDKITQYTLTDKNIFLSNGYAYSTIRLDYYFLYGDNLTTYQIEQRKLSSLLRLEAVLPWKGENDGMDSTMILTIPQLRAVNGMRMTFGTQANPNVGVFDFIAIPQHNVSSANLAVMEMVQLDSDIL